MLFIARHAGNSCDARRKTRLDKDLLRPTCIIKKIIEASSSFCLDKWSPQLGRLCCLRNDREAHGAHPRYFNSRSYLAPRSMHLSTAALCLSRFSGLPLGATRRRPPGRENRWSRVVRSEPLLFSSLFRRLIRPLVLKPRYDSIAPVVACRRSRWVDKRSCSTGKPGSIWLRCCLYIPAYEESLVCTTIRRD